MAAEVGALRGVDEPKNFTHSFSSCCDWQADEAIGGQGVDRGTSEELSGGGAWAWEGIDHCSRGVICDHPAF